MKKFFKEFRDFISRGNVLDMAVGVIIATAFGAITSSLINDILMPIIGLIFGGGDVSNLNIQLADGTVIGLGNFLGAVINFVIIAFIIFLILKAFNAARELSEKKKKAEEAAAAAAAAEAAAAAAAEPSREELLLIEIRDLLQKQAK